MLTWGKDCKDFGENLKLNQWTPEETKRSLLPTKLALLLLLYATLAKPMYPCLARSGYRPQCFRSAALAGGYSDVTLPYLVGRYSYTTLSCLTCVDARLPEQLPRCVTPNLYAIFVALELNLDTLKPDTTH
eukprot:1146484-Pelagomonas_calceolata.AAC.3